MDPGKYAFEDFQKHGGEVILVPEESDPTFTSEPEYGAIDIKYDVRYITDCIDAGMLLDLGDYEWLNKENYGCPMSLLIFGEKSCKGIDYLRWLSNNNSECRVHPSTSSVPSIPPIRNSVSLPCRQRTRPPRISPQKANLDPPPSNLEDTVEIIEIKDESQIVDEQIEPSRDFLSLTVVQNLQKNGISIIKKPSKNPESKQGNENRRKDSDERHVEGRRKEANERSHLFERNTGEGRRERPFERQERVPDHQQNKIDKKSNSSDKRTEVERRERTSKSQERVLDVRKTQRKTVKKGHSTDRKLGEETRSNTCLDRQKRSQKLEQKRLERERAEREERRQRQKDEEERKRRETEKKEEKSRKVESLSSGQNNTQLKNPYIICQKLAYIRKKLAPLTQREPENELLSEHSERRTRRKSEESSVDELQAKEKIRNRTPVNQNLPRQNSEEDLHDSKNCGRYKKKPTLPQKKYQRRVDESSSDELQTQIRSIDKDHTFTKNLIENQNLSHRRVDESSDSEVQTQRRSKYKEASDKNERRKNANFIKNQNHSQKNDKWQEDESTDDDVQIQRISEYKKASTKKDLDRENSEDIIANKRRKFDNLIENRNLYQKSDPRQEDKNSDDELETHSSGDEGVTPENRNLSRKNSEEDLPVSKNRAVSQERDKRREDKSSDNESAEKDLSPENLEDSIAIKRSKKDNLIENQNLSRKNDPIRDENSGDKLETQRSEDKEVTHKRNLSRENSKEDLPLSKRSKDDSIANQIPDQNMLQLQFGNGAVICSQESVLQGRSQLKNSVFTQFPSDSVEYSALQSSDPLRLSLNQISCLARIPEPSSQDPSVSSPKKNDSVPEPISAAPSPNISVTSQDSSPKKIGSKSRPISASPSLDHSYSSQNSAPVQGTSPGVPVTSPVTSPVPSVYHSPNPSEYFSPDSVIPNGQEVVTQDSRDLSQDRHVLSQDPYVSSQDPYLSEAANMQGPLTSTQIVINFTQLEKYASVELMDEDEYVNLGRLDSEDIQRISEEAPVSAEVPMEIVEADDCPANEVLDMDSSRNKNPSEKVSSESESEGRGFQSQSPVDKEREISEWLDDENVEEMGNCNGNQGRRDPDKMEKSLNTNVLEEDSTPLLDSEDHKLLGDDSETEFEKSTDQNSPGSDKTIDSDVQIIPKKDPDVEAIESSQCLNKYSSNFNEVVEIREEMNENEKNQETTLVNNFKESPEEMETVNEKISSHPEKELSLWKGSDVSDAETIKRQESNDITVTLQQKTSENSQEEWERRVLSRKEWVKEFEKQFLSDDESIKITADKENVKVRNVSAKKKRNEVMPKKSVWSGFDSDEYDL